jgi:hypothetical protein
VGRHPPRSSPPPPSLRWSSGPRQCCTGRGEPAWSPSWTWTNSSCVPTTGQARMPSVCSPGRPASRVGGVMAAGSWSKPAYLVTRCSPPLCTRILRGFPAQRRSAASSSASLPHRRWQWCRGLAPKGTWKRCVRPVRHGRAWRSSGREMESGCFGQRPIGSSATYWLQSSDQGPASECRSIRGGYRHLQRTETPRPSSHSRRAQVHSRTTDSGSVSSRLPR